MQVLGHTLPEIAAEKAGIFKRGASAVTVPQRPDAMQTLMVRAFALERLTDLSVWHTFANAYTSATHRLEQLLV